MTSVDVKSEARTVWALGDPWCWGLLGLGAGTGALLWARFLGDAFPAGRFSLIVISLLAVAAAVWLQLRSPAAFLDARPVGTRNPMILGLILLDAALVGGVTYLLLGQVLGFADLPWPVGNLVWLWIAVAPWCALRALVLWQRRIAGQPLGIRLESSCLLTLSAVAVFMACWAFYLGAEWAWDCDSFRLLLAVAALMLFAAAPLVAAPSWLRRVVVSVLVVLHLGGIVTATLAAPPGPWLAVQVWSLGYRPYLEFMYLNNAYRFYSPEPAPATQLWFRIEYKDDDGRVYSRWSKLPDVDGNGTPKYLVGLQFQRRLALTENVTRTVPAPPFVVRDEAGRLKPTPMYKRRDDQSPTPEFRGVLGAFQPVNPKGIPYHPDGTLPQYAQPESFAKQMLQSYARHILQQPPPDATSWDLNLELNKSGKPPAANLPLAEAGKRKLQPWRVKIYRVLHRIAEPDLLGNKGNDPQDWTFFLPYYQGMFDTDGTLLDPEDPFLYWILPILRQNPGDPNSPIQAWMFFHAGDDDWVKRPGQKRGLQFAP